jgi:hypothetical protein
MKTWDRWENWILLVSAVALLPIWLAQSREVDMPSGVLSLLRVLQFVVLVVLVTILIRRVRRMVAAFRESRNR